jgi:hypothetical protein
VETNAFAPAVASAIETALGPWFNGEADLDYRAFTDLLKNRGSHMNKPLYMLVPGSELYDLHRRYGSIVGITVSMSPDEWPFTLHDSSPKAPPGKVTIVELENGVYWLIVGTEPGQLRQFGALPVEGVTGR